MQRSVRFGSLDGRRCRVQVVAVYKITGGIPYASVGFAGIFGALTGFSSAGITVHGTVPCAVPRGCVVKLCVTKLCCRLFPCSRDVLVASCAQRHTVRCCCCCRCC